MTTLLYVESSPRKGRSHSISVAKDFIDAFVSSHPGTTVDTLDLWSTSLPEFDGYTIDAKYRILHGESYTPEEAAAWESVVATCDRFNAADVYLFSIPMWNFAIPYKLKHYIDVITQPGLTFSFSPEEGYKGLVTGKPAAVVYARGGDYSSEGMQNLDHQKSYFELLLGFIGFTDIHSILVQPTLAAPDTLEQVKRGAKETASRIAQSL